MNEFDAFKATFFDECAELLGELEEQFAAIEAGDHSASRLNAAFRAVHSIKGGAGAFGFAELVGFAHAYETLMDKVRAGHVALSGTSTALCIRANDVLADFVAAARDAAPIAPGHGEAEIAGFEAMMRGEAVAAPADSSGDDEFDLDFVPVMVDLDARQSAPRSADAPLVNDRLDGAPLAENSGQFEIRFVPHAELYARANDPLLLFRELATLGELTVRAMMRDLPLLPEFEAFGVYAGWELTLISSTASEAAITSVFEFVEGLCELEILRLDSSADAEAGQDAAFHIAAEETPGFAALAAELAQKPPAPPAAQARQTPGAAERVEADSDRRTVQSIRVDLDKVDRVVNMVGELVITQSMLNQQMDETLRSRYQELVRGLEVLAQTTRGLQDSVMAIRAQPVKSVFSRMPRLVRDLMARTGKSIRLEMAGENTEIDKTIIEQIADPLTHMIRNSADHGIEAADARLAAGKPRQGTIKLSAEQAGGKILIIVEDDGAGIDRPRVLALARERGLVAPEQALSEEEIDALIFAPGFSTAEAVSDISGRGVGMDVVRANIDKIGGSVDVRSWPGRGTRVTLRLPLTLAVLDVMLVRLAGAPYVVPLSAILETIQCARAEFGLAPSGTPVLRVRGEYVQVIDLAEAFGMASPMRLDERFVVLCEAEGDNRVALLVDDIVGQQQVVIKSLEENFERVDGIAGGTILGDGSVGLIVDVEGLRTMTGRKRAA